mmetsp:Transcript_1875/g.5169  ORF Transcript_1875/g.5169 Transcript_1875/m.5169 type:complete len:262 (-) Transcript_1875:88-873(-)
MRCFMLLHGARLSCCVLQLGVHTHHAIVLGATTLYIMRAWYQSYAGCNVATISVSSIGIQLQDHFIQDFAADLLPPGADADVPEMIVHHDTEPALAGVTIGGIQQRDGDAVHDARHDLIRSFHDAHVEALPIQPSAHVARRLEEGVVGNEVGIHVVLQRARVIGQGLDRGLEQRRDRDFGALDDPGVLEVGDDFVGAHSVGFLPSRSDASDGGRGQAQDGHGDGGHERGLESHAGTRCDGMGCRRLFCSSSYDLFVYNILE